MTDARRPRAKRDSAAPEAVNLESDPQMLTSGATAGIVLRFGGKWFLIGGITAFAAGMAYMNLVAGPDSSRWSLLPGLILAGLGLGFTWGPTYSLATRDLQPELAGVASGVLSTIQELGTVIASAAVGALLQNRLAIALHDRAVADSGQLPEGFRHQFVSAFSRAAQGGLEIGGGQTGGRLGLPAGVPAAVVHQLQALAADVFRQAFVDAMHPTLVLPIAVVMLAAVGCLAVRGQKRSVPDEEVAVMRAAG